ncbi:hypothetical protein [Pseudochrobactrum sp. B5]|uniref:hypothetical protein n=1 Tax=Pseudochrobactrum sp. B5 TaxID=1289478 RepID=UPI000951450F|nr:hypothetical protein [Pseudochrobactrum sp. B5]
MALATRYWQAARLVIQHQIRPVEHLEPVGYLLAMCSEIALKAFLSEKGMSDDQLAKRLGHDLTKCLRQAIDKGLQLGEREAECILNMRDAHMNHFNRYGMPSINGKLKLGAVLLTDEVQSLECTAILIDRISEKPNVLRDRHQHPAPLSWPMPPAIEQPITLHNLDQINQRIRERLKVVELVNSRHP